MLLSLNYSGFFINRKRFFSPKKYVAFLERAWYPHNGVIVRKILIFCLYCVIFTLIPAVSLLAQGGKDKSLKDNPFPALEEPVEEDEFYLVSDTADDEDNPSHVPEISIIPQPSPASEIPDDKPASVPEIPAVSIDSRSGVEAAAAEPAAPVQLAQIDEPAAVPPQPLPPQPPSPQPPPAVNSYGADYGLQTPVQPPQPTVNPYGADYGLQPPSPPPPAPSRLPPQPPIRTIGPTVNIILPPAVPPAASSAAPPAYRPSINVIPGMPDPYGNGVYRVQLGSFSNGGLAQQCFNRLKSAGFTPYYEQYGSLYRVVITGVTAADMAGVVQRLEAAGFSEAWIREER
jgi:hypothetical protein